MRHQLKQLIPSEVCLACDVCCRFPERQGPMVPIFSLEEQSRAIKLGLSKHDFPSPETKRGVQIQTKPLGDCFRCPAFEPDTHQCQIYPERPFDCQLYPYLLMFDSDKQNVLLVLDPLCPYVQTHTEETEVKEYSVYLIYYLSHPQVIQWISQHQNLVSEFRSGVIPITKLERLTKAMIPSFIRSGLKPLRIEDRSLFNSFFAGKIPTLAYENFLFHYLWSEILRYYWTQIQGQFCLFAEFDRHLFMPIPPLGEEFNPKVIRDCFELMDFWNKNRSVSRISGLREEDKKKIKIEPSQFSLVEYDYVYLRNDLVHLRGNQYKTKRAGYNQFIRCYPDVVYRFFSPKDIPGCLALYETWLQQYRQRPVTEHQIQMAQDNYTVHQKGMLEYQQLGLTGRVIEVEGKIIGYTFGYPLSEETFYVLFEIADITFKGISQYLFREFCKEMSCYSLIHAGGDSGLSSLRQVKLSYHPAQILPIYQMTHMSFFS